MSNIEKGKWMFNIGGYETWTGEQYDTKEIAIKEGRLELISENKLDSKLGFNVVTSFEVGQVAEVPATGVNVDSILEDVAENTTNDIGEVGEDYLNDVTKEHSDELEEKLNEVLFAWMKERGYEPNFWIMENIEDISV